MLGAGIAAGIARLRDCTVAGLICGAPYLLDTLQSIESMSLSFALYHSASVTVCNVHAQAWICLSTMAATEHADKNDDDEC